MGNLSKHFDIQEFVPKSTYENPHTNPLWFISPIAVKCAEFYKSFFTTYYKNKYGNDKVKTVLIKINDYSYGGSKQYSGYRPPSYTKGAKESQHRHHNAFDCEIIIVFTDGTQKEADYIEIHQIIKDNEAEFMANGVTTVEDVSIAKGWLHTDFRWTGLKNILIVKP